MGRDNVCVSLIFRSIRPAWILLALLGGFFATGLPSHADTAANAYAAMGLKPAQVLTGTTLNVKVVPGSTKQLVCVTSYMTGSKTRSEAINVRVDVFQTVGRKLKSIYSRDFGAENGGFVSDGDLQVIDLTGDGVAEIVVSYKSFKSPVIEERLGEIITYGKDGFSSPWAGPLRYDATKAARDVPEERRDRFVRELDLAGTIRTRGESIVFEKTVVAIAGERLAEPRVVSESYPFGS